VLKSGLPDWVSPACGQTGSAAPANPTGNPDFNLKIRPEVKKSGPEFDKKIGPELPELSEFDKKIGR
jgi:hypothetical protein